MGVIYNVTQSLKIPLNCPFHLGRILPVMTKKVLEKYQREGGSLIKVINMFPNDDTAEEWFIKTRWPDGVECPKCGSDNIQERPTRKPQRFRCRSCRKDFSVKTNSLMQGSNLGYRVWVLAIYLLTMNLKGVSSMKLHRDLGITQKSAWHLAHRLRETWSDNSVFFSDPVEVDETYIGGKEKNKHEDKRRYIRDNSGKAIVVGIKDRDTDKVSAKPVLSTDKENLNGFIHENVSPEAKVCTYEHRGYMDFPCDHERAVASGNT